MTKYILHGGNTRDKNSNNKSFYQEMVKGLDQPKILVVSFAKTDEEWRKVGPQHLSRVQEFCNVDQSHIEVSREDKFEEQLKNADVIYLVGGDTPRPFRKLKEYSQFK